MGMKYDSKHFIFNGENIAGGESKRIGCFKLKSGNLKRKGKLPVFDKNGHVTLESISARREFFLGKSISRLEHELHKFGYKTTRRPSKFDDSRAKIIITLNSSKNRNITQIQVSPGSKRHGNIPYVKISTSDIGRIKIIAGTKDAYKTDGKENAIILFRRKK